MFKPCFINGNQTQKFLFKKFSNMLTKIKAIAKNNYFKKELKDLAGEPKKLGKFFANCYPLQLNVY